MDDSNKKEEPKAVDDDNKENVTNENNENDNENKKEPNITEFTHTTTI